jgi:hypothetical protein
MPSLSFGGDRPEDQEGGDHPNQDRKSQLPSHEGSPQASGIYLQ